MLGDRGDGGSHDGGPGTGGRVLVVDDDATVAEVVARYLRRDGFAVEVVPDGPSALARAEAVRPDLDVADLLFPGVHGPEVLRRLRERTGAPVVVLGALSAEADRVAGFEPGADDYVPKPFSPRELAARVKSVLRPTPPDTAGGPTCLSCGDAVVDLRAHEVRRGGRVVPLTSREFDLLVFFLRHPGRAFRREEPLEAVWGWTYGDASTVTVHVRRRREKIEVDPARLITAWGVGYRFDP